MTRIAIAQINATLGDIKLNKITSRQGDNYWDISFTDGDFTMTKGLETSFLMSVFCEQRDEFLEDPSSRGGWAGNELQPIQGFQQGSLLWTLYQSPALEDAATEAQNILEDSFQWYIDDLIAKEVQVETIIVENYKLQGKISVIANDDTEFVNYYDLWYNTINNN